MFALFWFIFGAGFTVLAIAAGVTLRARRRHVFSRGEPALEDWMIHEIIERGEIFVDEDEPLDFAEIDEEEDRFWSESWDLPSEEERYSSDGWDDPLQES